MDGLEPKHTRSVDYEPDYFDLDEVERYIHGQLDQIKSSLSQTNSLETGIAVSQLRKIVIALETMHSQNVAAVKYLSVALEDLNEVPNAALADAFEYLKALKTILELASTEIRQPR